MKRFLGTVAMVGVMGLLGASVVMGSTSKHSHSAAKEEAKTTTLRGEVVDMGCYLEHGAKGEKHKECAAKCIAGGMPMGLLTDNGKIYLIMLNHDNPDPFNKLKDMASSMVEVSGTVSARGGVSAIDASDVKMASAKK